MDEAVFVEADSIGWESGRDVLARMAPEFRANLGPEEQVEDLFSRYHQKSLRLDQATSRRMDIVRLDPGYRDLSNAYHDSVEECLVLDGEVDLDGEGHFEVDDYFWRPPGWVHAAETQSGCRLLLMFQGEDPAEGSGRVSRHVRPDEEAGTNALHPGSLEEAVGPRGWVLRQPTHLLAWQPGPCLAAADGPLFGFDLDRLSFKVLSKNCRSGGQSLKVRMHAGYRQPTPGRLMNDVELFVLAGSLRIGDWQLTTNDYARIPGGVEYEPWVSDIGAEVFMKADGRLTSH